MCSTARASPWWSPPTMWILPTGGPSGAWCSAGARILAEGPPEAIFDRPEVVEQARLRQPTLYRVAKALGLPKEEGWPKGIEELEQRLGGGQI